MAEPGLVRLAPDFGASEGGGTMTRDELCDQGIGLIEEAQQERVTMLDGNGNWDADRDTYRALVVQAYDHRMGPIRNVLEAIKALPKVPDAPPAVTPPPARTLGPGQTRTFQTATGQQIRVAVPNVAQTGLPVVLVFAGTGFQGASIGMLPLAEGEGLALASALGIEPDEAIDVLSQHYTGTYVEPETVQNLFTAAGAIYVEVAYRGSSVGARVDVQVQDAQAAYDYATQHAAEWGGNPALITVVGHSSGGYLCAWLAITRPVALATLMSGAALLVNGYNWPAQSQQLLAAAGVGESNAPGTHIREGQQGRRFIIMIADQDEQIPPPSEAAFAQRAQQAGHSVSVQHVPGLHGASIDPGLRATVAALPR